jgi:imidazoleglycerol phosphate synthase glutamine amidotransferase subunit HisH
MFGVQFHIEKSGDLGLKVLDNFAKTCKGKVYGT